MQPSIRHSRCLTCQFIKQGQKKHTSVTTKEERYINNHITCNSSNLIYIIQCKNALNVIYRVNTSEKPQNASLTDERFGEHRRSVENPHNLSCPTFISEHFNLPGHSTKDMQLIPLELIRNSRDSVRKARETYLIDKGKMLEPLGINSRDELY